MWISGAGAPITHRKSLPSHPPLHGRVRLIGIYDVMSVPIGCCILLLILWQFSESESYIYIKGRQERWQTMAALRADTEDQLVFGSGDSLNAKQRQLFQLQQQPRGWQTIELASVDSHAICNDGKASHFYNAFTPMHVLIYYLTLVAKETKRTGVINLCPVWTGKPRHGVPSPLPYGELGHGSLPLRNGLQSICHQYFPWKEIWKKTYQN